jgi:hypothetical protein
LYCSRACQQKAYRLRHATVTQSGEGTTTHATVTPPEMNQSFQCVTEAKNDHARSVLSLPVGYAYSDWKPSWQPHWPAPTPIATKVDDDRVKALIEQIPDDLSIPAFLRRPAVATVTSDAPLETAPKKKLAA